VDAYILHNKNLINMKHKVVIFGTLDTAELAHYYLTNDSKYEVVAFTVNKEYIEESTFTPRGSRKKYPVVPFEELEKHYPPTEYRFFCSYDWS
jgi:hypothetical protein